MQRARPKVCHDNMEKYSLGSLVSRWCPCIHKEQRHKGKEKRTWLDSEGKSLQCLLCKSENHQLFMYPKPHYNARFACNSNCMQ